MHCSVDGGVATITLDSPANRNALSQQLVADLSNALDRAARMRQRTIDVARTPGQSGGSHVLSYSTSASGIEAAALCGSPDDIARKLEALQAVGVHYLLASMGGGSRDTLRRFAREIAPEFNTRAAAPAGDNALAGGATLAKAPS